MKITSFDPLILSPKAGDVVKFFEELGFERTHNPTVATETAEREDTRMKDQNGFHVDVASVTEIPRDMTCIRMNVDDFETAYQILTAHGFKNTRGDNTLDTSSSKADTMISPAGLTIALVKHIKKHN